MTDGMRSKACNKCGTVKFLDEFARDPRNKATGRNGICRACNNASAKAKRTPETRAADVRRLMEWRKTPAGKAARRREYVKGRDKTIARALAWNRAHPDVRRELVRRRRERLAVPKGSRTLVVSRVQIAAKWAYWGGRCWVCGDVATQTDHVKPVAAGGVNLLCNLRPICGPCNRTKSGKWPFNLKEIAA